MVSVADWRVFVALIYSWKFISKMNEGASVVRGAKGNIFGDPLRRSLLIDAFPATAMGLVQTQFSPE